MKTQEKTVKVYYGLKWVEFLIYENEPIYTPTHQCYIFADRFYKGLCIMIICKNNKTP